MDRLIGSYEGQKKGPLVLVLGAVHGNEPAGVEAFQGVLDMLEKEHLHHPDFIFSGKILGFIGNIAAFQQNKRFIRQDLNRMFNYDWVEQVIAQSPSNFEDEDYELVALLQAIQQEIVAYQPHELIILDLHTTSADGGIFSIPLESDPESIRMATALHAPVVMGLLAGLDHTFMHYANHSNSVFRATNRAVHTVAFEAGQHNDPLSVNRCVSAIISLLRAVGCMMEKDVSNQHDEILRKYAKDLPKLTYITHVQHIAEGERFKMRPGYINFKFIYKGEYLADNEKGPILAPSDGHILMPLYQTQGVDGFFIVNTQPN
jgi:succinylglutamate desuccinylase